MQTPVRQARCIEESANPLQFFDFNFASCAAHAREAIHRGVVPASGAEFGATQTPAILLILA